MDEPSSAILTNKSQHVARQLLERIVRENLGPGASFGTEAELIELFQVSRPTLREGLRILESQGIVSLRPGPKGGIHVATPSVELLAQTLSVFLRLNNVPLIEILRARMAIEPALVRDAALNGSEADFDDMERSIERLAAAKDDDGQVLYVENREFHNIIARAAGNKVLEMFWLSIRALASGEGERIKFTEQNKAHIVQSHREILAACRKRDPAAAYELMLSHLGELDQLLRKLFKGRMEEPGKVTYLAGRKLR